MRNSGHPTMAVPGIAAWNWREIATQGRRDD
ncbi:hypothetical protein BRAO285_260011 [Bradyrhizobium sp. ORS 285]|nr:hypothetical protein BRAO285_260011 [Bradyrhizobium sp. ORS 285]